MVAGRSCCSLFTSIPILMVISCLVMLTFHEICIDWWIMTLLVIWCGRDFYQLHNCCVRFALHLIFHVLCCLLLLVCINMFQSAWISRAGSHWVHGSITLNKLYCSCYCTDEMTTYSISDVEKKDELQKFSFISAHNLSQVHTLATTRKHLSNNIKRRLATVYIGSFGSSHVGNWSCSSREIAGQIFQF